VPEDNSAARNPIGPVGQHVIENVRQLREARRLSYTDLSAKLGDLGRPIPTLGLSRMERGARRVDADDLVAIAMALGVNPSALLLPRAGSADDEIDLAPNARYASADAWGWADGRGPLPGQPGGAHDFLVYARPEYIAHKELEYLEELLRERREPDVAGLRRQLAELKESLTRSPDDTKET
jgi:transcriptional regulator with XRE-family HTH domain